MNSDTLVMHEEKEEFSFEILTQEICTDCGTLWVEDWEDKLPGKILSTKRISLWSADPKKGSRWISCNCQQRLVWLPLNSLLVKHFQQLRNCHICVEKTFKRLKRHSRRMQLTSFFQGASSLRIPVLNLGVSVKVTGRSTALTAVLTSAVTFNMATLVLRTDFVARWNKN